MDSILTQLDQLPSDILDRDARGLHQVLKGPTLIHLEGRRSEPLFVSVLLHGNEDVGWEAVRRVLAHYQNRELPRSLSLFIGNVRAACHGKRLLEGQPDYNRIWTGEGSLPEHKMVCEVLDEMEHRNVFACIDVHNNTGFNPHYACINRLDPAFQHLAVLFSRTVVYFEQPDTVLSKAFASLCPSITIECGKPGETHGVQHAMDCIEAGLHLEQFPDHAVARHDIDLFHTVAVVKIPRSLKIGFADKQVDVRLIEQLDQLNFNELKKGTLLGWVSGEANPGIKVWNDEGRDVSERFFKFSNNEIRTSIPVMPSMLTLDTEVIYQDCLCYLMERLPH